MSGKRLTRSTSDRMFFGVAGGVANYLNLDPTLIRVLFVLFTLMGGPGLIVYIVLAIVMPEDDYAGTVEGFDPEEVVIKDVE